MHEIGEEMTWVDGRGRGRDEIAKFLSPIPYRRGNQPSAQLEKVILFREGIERERESERARESNGGEERERERVTVEEERENMRQIELVVLLM